MKLETKQQKTPGPVKDLWPENPSQWILLSLDFVIVDVSGGLLHLMSLDPVHPFSTDCPEVIGLVNHSATALIIVKALILYNSFIK